MGRNRIKAQGVEADLTEFNRANAALATLTGKPLEEVIRGRVGIILAAAVKKSKIKKVGTLRKGASGKHSQKEVTGSSVKAALYQTLSKPSTQRNTYVRINGRWINAKDKLGQSQGRRQTGGWTVGKGFAQKLQQTHLNQKADFKEKVEVDKAARGLGARAFVEMGRKLRLGIPAKGYVKSANYRGKTLRSLSRGRKGSDNKGSAFVEISTKVGKADKRAIFTAARGQNKAMATAVRRSKADQIQGVARRFAGIQVK